MKRLSLALLVATLCSGFLQAQVVKISNGGAFSSVHADQGAGVLENHVGSYSGFLGIEYLEKKWFMLSSEIGYFQQGGEEKEYVLVRDSPEDPGTMSSWTMKNDYIQLNTTFRAMTTTYPLFLYAGAGPKLDILVSGKDIVPPGETKAGTLERCIWGLKTEIGIGYEINDRFRMELNGSYDFNFNKAGSMPVMSPETTPSIISSDLSYRTFKVMATVGYRL